MLDRLSEITHAQYRKSKKNDANLKRFIPALQAASETCAQAGRRPGKTAICYRALAERMKSVFWTLDMKTLRFSYISPSVSALTGFKPEEIVGRSLESTLASAKTAVEMHKFITHTLKAILQAERLPKKNAFLVPLEILCKNGKSLWGECLASYHWDRESGALSLQGAFRDMTKRRKLQRELVRRNKILRYEIEKRKQTERALAKSEAWYRTLADNMKDVVWALDATTLRLTYISPSSVELFGFTPQELMDRPLHFFLTTDSATRALATIARLQEKFKKSGMQPQHASLELEILCKGGKTAWVENLISYRSDKATDKPLLQGSMRDITERRALSLQLKLQATVDELTGLYNRRYFIKTLEKEIQRCLRDTSTFAIIMFDIDHFKRINDMYGHQSGDKALREMSATLRARTRITDCLSRSGGEEFTLILPQTDFDQAMAMAEIFRQAVASLCVIAENGEKMAMSISLGVAVFRPGIDTMNTLIARADRGLYMAKKQGRNRVAADGEDGAWPERKRLVSAPY